MSLVVGLFHDVAEVNSSECGEVHVVIEFIIIIYHSFTNYIFLSRTPVGWIIGIDDGRLQRDKSDIRITMQIVDGVAINVACIEVLIV